LRHDSHTAGIYGKTTISERHRHRYEFNNEFMTQFEQNGMIPAGINPQTGLVEVVEIKEHPFFIGTQFHPEYKSTVENPHPLFIAFIKAAKDYQDARKSTAIKLFEKNSIA
jgi:CTP synthase